jgi:hypothetical protein
MMGVFAAVVNANFAKQFFLKLFQKLNAVYRQSNNHSLLQNKS